MVPVRIFGNLDLCHYDIFCFFCRVSLDPLPLISADRKISQNHTVEKTNVSGKKRGGGDYDDQQHTADRQPKQTSAVTKTTKIKKNRIKI